MTPIGFLHTSSLHVPTFDALLSEIAPGTAGHHVVDEALLADAGARGVDAGIEARLLRRLKELAAPGPEVIVCTCSTFSGLAERLAEQVRVAVLRIDRPMAEHAVASGGRIAVVAAVASTLGPTRELFEECAARCGSAAVVVDAPCLEAWALFAGGDLAGFYDAIAGHVRDLADDFDVVVLAQASMAPAAALLSDLAVPVLTSPRLAVQRAVEMAAAAPGSRLAP
jgi:aspartate/glutamate racemase